MAVKALEALWEYREASREHRSKPETVKDSKRRLDALIARLQGKPEPTAARAQQAKPKVHPQKIAALRDSLLALSDLAPQPRGYASMESSSRRRLGRVACS